MCMCMYVCYVHRRPEEGSEFFGARIIGGCELAYQEQISDLHQEQFVLLTTQYLSCS